MKAITIKYTTNLTIINRNLLFSACTLLLVVICGLHPTESIAQTGDQVSESAILSMKERARLIDDVLADRIETVLPNIMRREGMDMWIIISREYNEDPIIETMLPSTWLAARRRTILIIYDLGPGKGLETLAVAGTMWVRYSKRPGIRKWSPISGSVCAKSLMSVIRSE